MSNREPLEKEEEVKEKPKEEDLIEEYKQKTKNAMKRAKEELEKRLRTYLESVPSVKFQNKSKEFEIRFGTGRNISKIDYDNVIKQIMAEGFISDNKNGLQILRIYSDYKDPKTGQIKGSTTRAEIVGTDLISEYCATNSIKKIIEMTSTEPNKIKFTKKISPIDNAGKYEKPIDFVDMGFRVDYKYEEDFGIGSRISQNIIDKWADNKKKFRLINRVQFRHPEYPILVDISIVKTNKQVKSREEGKPVDVKTYTIQESQVFENPEKYEIELEIDNMRVGPGQYDQVMQYLRKVIRIIMSGIQGTSYPISVSDRNSVLEGYLRLIHGDEYKSPYDIAKNFKFYISSQNFIGPSSLTLQIDNIVEQSNSKLPNICRDYTVTDKADGDRKLLYVNEKGLIYFIDGNMNVQFTGSQTKYEFCFNSLLDGEHIKYNKMGEFINLFKAFDIYFVNSKSFMHNSFFPRPIVVDVDEAQEVQQQEEEKEKGDKKNETTRNELLQQFIEKLKPVSVLKENNVKEVWQKQTIKDHTFWFEIKSGKKQLEPPKKKNPTCNLRVECKEFFKTSKDMTIFEGCSKILSNIQDNSFEYNTDGLIFTPAYSPVGSIAAGLPGLLRKYRWDESFKWKPAEFNTIDFLVSVYKENGKDKINHIFEEGTNTCGNRTIIEYKTLILQCGVNKTDFAKENPFNDIIHERLPSPNDRLNDTNDKKQNKEDYEPRPFEPTEPFDPQAWMCNIIVKNSGEDEGNYIMTTEEGEYFEESTIVEFRYDITAEPGWNWKPIRVRHDKTQKLLQGQKEFGNAYYVANSNWYSIHNPITKRMITTGENLPEQVVRDEDIYYIGDTKDSRTAAMRNFHNLYVKKKLILGVASPDHTLIDYAVGKGGDLAKWRQAKLSMVLGVDLSRDNISGARDNACSRYLDECRKFDKVPYCLFLKGDSGLNIRTLDAFPGDKTSKERLVASAVFGKGPKDPTLLGKGVYNRYGIGEQGFNISSCQFAIHYFFENPRKLHAFIKNVAECTRIQGYFISTGYDGNAVFRLLRHKKEDEGAVFFTEDRMGKKKKICEIIKKYSQDGFQEDETSIGYRIEVFQETIQKTSVEYLVNFQYLVRIMENYGFELISDGEAKQMGLPHSSGLFEELFTAMQTELEKDPRKRSDYKEAQNMSNAEKQISFLNRYCIFRKVASVSKETMDQLARQANALYTNESENVSPELQAVFSRIENQQPATSGNVKKLKVRLVLKKKSKPLQTSPSQIKEEEPTELDLKEELELDVGEEEITLKEPEPQPEPQPEPVVEPPKLQETEPVKPKRKLKIVPKK
jgi:hypothetical protein